MLEGYVLSKHARAVLGERQIPEEWLWRTIGQAEWDHTGDDNNMHYFKSIPEQGNRILHVVVNPRVSPKKLVTVFFDRRARRPK